jgi:transcriptional antiterminator NusG
MGLFVVKVTGGMESKVAEMIAEQSSDVYATLSPEDMKGYMVVEIDDDSSDRLERIVDDIPHSNRVLDEIEMNEIENFLQSKNDVEGIEVGSIVRITGGPFQGEKARVKDISKSDETLTVELTEATVPIPVDLRGNQVRVIDK